VRMVVSELRGEKIDIIPFNEEPARFVAKALSPARVREVLVDDEARQATVIVPDDQLSLAIGKDGLNARLAARLTGWRVDIRSETEFAEEEAQMGYTEEEVAGRCAAILANGKRCPNASLPGSRYCGLPAHQELEAKGTDYVVPPEGEGEAGAEDGEAAAEDAAAESPLAESPSAESPSAESPSADELVGEQPSVDEVLQDQPAAEEVVGDQPSVDEIVEGGPAPAPAEAESEPEAEAAEPVAESASESSPEEEES
jgi:N utilization substance protein A